MPDYNERPSGLNEDYRIDTGRSQMAILNHIKSLIAAFVMPVEAHYMLDTTAYHSQPDERELRFSPSSVLRRHY
jgi:hypothetical protein